ncbi:MAG: RNA repair domain-containing protein [Promethearchaeota archaeon]
MTRDILNRLIWDSQFRDPEYVEVEFIHRGAFRDKKNIVASRVTKVLPSFFVYEKRGTQEEVYIPFHRITSIIDLRTGESLYQKADTREG